MKIIKKSKMAINQAHVELMASELEVLKSTNHPNIMSIIEILEDDHYYYVISEILEGGELFDRIMEQKNFSEKKAAFIIK